MPFFEDWDALESLIEGHRASLETRPVVPQLSTVEIQDRLEREFDFAKPLPLEEVMARVGALLQDGIVHATHPGYFGLYCPDLHPAGLAADAIVAAFNPQLSVHTHAPAPNEIERFVLREFLNALGWSPDSVATFTSGGSEANHTGVLAGLTAKLEGFAERGLDGRRPVVYVSAEAHHSLIKIGCACGLGRSGIREVRVDASLGMDVEHLRAQIADDRRADLTPAVIVATLGTTSSGAIDPVAAIAGVAREENLWLHVDAAWGGAALIVPSLRPHLPGIERADSVTVDAHKWLSVPMGAGMFFCQSPAPVAEAFGIQAAYMPVKEAGRDNYTHTLQWSRRLIGLKLFMTLAHLGRERYAETIAHQAAMTDLLARRLAEVGWRVIYHSPFAVLTFLPPDDRDLDAIATRVVAGGRSWISKTVLSHHGPVLRACVTNYRTQPEHVERLVEDLIAAL